MVNYKQIDSYAHENGGRVLLLFLLFLMALYQFRSAGLAGIAMICAIPAMIILAYLAFKYRMLTFWILMVYNYIPHFLFRCVAIPLPMSLTSELLEILLIAIAIIDLRDTHFERTVNLMHLAIGIWCTYCTLEILNNTCDLGLNFGVWFTGVRMIAYQLIYIFLVFSLYISNPDRLMKYIKFFAYLSIFAAFWAWKQKTFGFTQGEWAFLNSGDHLRLHMINGVMRYFSVLSDAANFGCCMAASAVIFYIFAITTKIKRDRILFLITAFATTWGMFASGTRTSIFVLILGFAGYIILSKSIKIAVPVTLFFGVFVFFLAFTNVANGNPQIRRMRSAFNKDDASLGTREMHKIVMKKYMKEAPFGIGIIQHAQANKVPANNKYWGMAHIPPDSEYVYIWLRTGEIGMTIFLVCIALIIIGASWIVLFRLQNSTMRGIGAGFTCAFIGIQLGAYANQVLLQFPNCMLFFGGAAIVYVLPFIEPEFIKLEEKRMAEQQERERLKLEKKKASRV